MIKCSEVSKEKKRIKMIIGSLQTTISLEARRRESSVATR